MYLVIAKSFPFLFKVVYLNIYVCEITRVLAMYVLPNSN